MVQIKRVEFVSAKKLQAHIYDDEKFSSFDEKLHLWFDIANFSFSFHQRMDWAYQQMRLAVKCCAADDPSVPQSVFTITEKAPTRAFSWLKGAFNQEKILVGAFPVIVQLRRLIVKQL